ncbi:MAG: glycosyltransferase family 39 protein, partial [Candidatus Omnitrophica bacterium]|nr:glycosyltransferase family 39 protein [Candidatus Omnitrophota bacterium]
MTEDARDRRWLWLALIFALGLGLRWSLVSVGPYHSDCLLLAVQSQKIILTGKMHYLQSSGLPLTALTGALFVAIFNAAEDLDRAVRAVNMMSVVFGSLSIWLVYWCAARMRDNATALLAALFCAINPFLIGMATFGNSHVLALFFLLASLCFLQLYADSGRRLDLIWAGCALGATGASRVQDLVAMAIPMTFLMVWQRHRQS